jgi:2-(1,2-epoxy-1,2-dihydrophenyl)acetyl-CoA isomerase
MACTALEIHDGIARLSFSRPEVLNALNVELLTEAVARLTELRRRDDVGAVVITGQGRGFSAGADLSLAGQQLGTDASVAQQVGYYMDNYAHPLIEAILTFPRPVVAAVNGPAVGGGAGIALAADIVLAARSAYFMIVQPARLGLVPDLGATWLLQRLVGRARALAASLLGERISAEQAEQWGMIWKCIDDEALLPQAMAVASQLAYIPALTVQATRELIDAATRLEPLEQMKRERDRQLELCGSAFFGDAVAAFIGKHQ